MTLKPSSGAPFVFAGLLFVLGLALAAGGLELVLLHGSPYYLLAGLALIVSGGLLWRGSKRGAWLYALIVAATLVWSFWEVGFDGWALASRNLALWVLGAWLFLPHVRRALT
jgi:quinoprotein glucose dehydrogenase